MATALQLALQPAAARQVAPARSSTRVVAFVAQPAAARRTLRHSSSGSSSRSTRRGALLVAAAAQAEVGKLISKVEIPAFIPRPDLIDQLVRWASIEIQENGVANCGCPCKVSAFYNDGQLWGFTVSFLKDGESAADVRVAFDDEITMKHEWVGRGADGFPVLEGKAEEIKGKHFEIRKVCDRQLTDANRNSIRDFCQLLVAAINKYYAFGSCFVDDST
ncbi:hypothetical protein C2E21_4544 isoform A [Chlorella sorokiniana]|uniref:Uncharacterized protein n=1 Tax=Chlorella sorokiniana TaxID=3076 RepID=A0A2P6TS38_CHLSO|nr:hypothetical protein C2E21_4544 isoform A [Chlorella sorokiniana]|eukprot:PRW56880.1 hypothetical protein C2E21_4544 isoform A [Chlorella sorokiniana]